MGLIDYFRWTAADAESKVLFLGLNNSGKTTILQRITTEDDLAIIKATTGYRIKTFSHQSIVINAIDCGGRKTFRSQWKSHFKTVDAVVFVIDSGDRRHIEEAGIELQKLLDDEQLSGVPFIILANKSEQMTSMTTNDVSTGLNLHSIRDRPWKLIAVSAKTGAGLEECLGYLSVQIRNRRLVPTANKRNAFV